MDLLNAKTESPHAVENLVCGLDPSKRPASVVVRVDVRQDGSAQLGNARMRPALQAFSVSNPKKRSTKLSHDA